MTCWSSSKATTCSRGTTLARLRDLVTDLQLIDGTRGIISLYSARQPPEGDHLPAPLFPDPLPEGAAYDQLIKKVMSNEILRGKLLSLDGKLTLVVLALDPEVVQSSKLRDVVGEIRKTMAEDLAGSGLSAELSGVPVMQLEIRNAVERDRIVYNALGFLGGCLIAILFFRRISFMIIAAAPPLLAILLALGTLGWLDFRLNMFLNVMTPLIMVISFSDSMQLTFATRDRIIAGQSKADALRTAVHVVGPACVLTHATAGLSFFALTFSELGPDPQLRRGRADRDADRARLRAHRHPAARHVPAAARSSLRRHGSRARTWRSMRCAGSAAGSPRGW